MASGERCRRAVLTALTREQEGLYFRNPWFKQYVDSLIPVSLELLIFGAQEEAEQREHEAKIQRKL